MTLLNGQQQQRAVDALREFLAASSGRMGRPRFKQARPATKSGSVSLSKTSSPSLLATLKARLFYLISKLRWMASISATAFGGSKESRVKCFST